MKKIFFVFLIMIICNLSYGQDIKGFVSDEVFKEYMNDNKEAFERKHDSDAIKLLLKDEKIDEAEFKTMHKALGFDTHDEFTTFLQLQSKRLQDLSKKYEVSSEDISAGSVDIRDGMKSLYDNSLADASTGEGICERRFSNCKLEADLAAVLGHLGCIAADLTIFLAGVCHSAVYGLHIIAYDNCKLDYLECCRNK